MRTFKSNNMPARERRQHNRYDFQQEIVYTLNPPDSAKINMGIIVNMSCSGMCLYASSPVRLGQEITVKRGNQYYVKGTIIWCSETFGRMKPYKFGLKYGPSLNSVCP